MESHKTAYQIFSLKSLVNKYTERTRNEKAYLCFVDFKKGTLLGMPCEYISQSKQKIEKNGKSNCVVKIKDN